jgi:hypothetical protein
MKRRLSPAEAERRRVDIADVACMAGALFIALVLALVFRP